MALAHPGQPLEGVERPDPVAGAGELVIEVRACGVCRTDLHIADGDLPVHRDAVIPGHQVVGVVREAGPGASRFATGDRVGLPWLGWTCGECRQCRAGRENLCEAARFTGYDVDGGYAELALADERYCLAVPDAYEDLAAAPLLCAGLVGYRALRLCGDPQTVAFYGFGSSAHILCQVAAGEGRSVLAITRPGDGDGQTFARELGAAWAGGTDEVLPEAPDAAVIFAPAGELVPRALGAVAPGGTVVCAGIHMTEIPAFAYELLWGERTLRSVANLTRADGEEFMRLAARTPIRTDVTPYRLDDANRALDDVRGGRVRGAAALMVGAEPEGEDGIR